MNQKHINWNEYYSSQAGGQNNYYQGSYFQRGYGLSHYQNGSGFTDLFRRFASWVVPIIKKHALPTIQSGVQALGREALDSAADVAKDLLSGKEFKESASNRYKTAVENIKQKVEDKFEGRGLKTSQFGKRKKKANYIILKKKKYYPQPYKNEILLPILIVLSIYG